MKEETKELIKWIKKQINLSGECLVAQPNEYWKEDCEKAMKFLDSLPQIESHLCRGGYIQDKNGTPCCEGDNVYITVSEDYRLQKWAGQTLQGSLAWNASYGRFYIITRHKDFEMADIVGRFVKKEN